MQTLSVVAVEDGALVVATAAGERFRLPVDAALRSRLLSTGTPPDQRRLSPREIQAHVRSGLSAEQVAAMTGAPVASIERFVGPVLAERAYIVESALAVRLPPETEGARARTFGAVMGERLDALAAKEVRWSSAKEPAGWVLAVRFTADDTAHDARWRFDPKHMGLEPDNVEASTLSQQGVPAALTPRLRAIEPTAPVAIIVPAVASASTAAPEKRARVEAAAEPTRFDSAAFDLDQAKVRPDRRSRKASSTAEGDAAAAEGAAAPVDLLPAPRGRASGEVFAARPQPAEPAPERVRTPARARTEPAGERDAFGRGGTEPKRDDAPVTPMRSRHAERTPVEDRPTEPIRRRRERTAPEGRAPTAEDAAARARRGRTSMPSWDEIVFGRDDG